MTTCRNYKLFQQRGADSTSYCQFNKYCIINVSEVSLELFNVSVLSESVGYEG